MTLVSLPGVTAETIANTSTEASAKQGRPFPCDPLGWIQHTGTVTEAALKMFNNGGEAISLKVANGGYSTELLVNLDCTGAPDPAKALDTLVKAGKIMGLFTATGQLDTSKIKANGQIVSFIAKHKGFTQGTDGRWFHKIGTILVGEAKTLAEVQQIQMPALPDAERAVVDDVPF